MNKVLLEKRLITDETVGPNSEELIKKNEKILVNRFLRIFKTKSISIKKYFLRKISEK